MYHIDKEYCYSEDDFLFVEMKMCEYFIKGYGTHEFQFQLVDLYEYFWWLFKYKEEYKKYIDNIPDDQLEIPIVEVIFKRWMREGKFEEEVYYNCLRNRFVDIYKELQKKGVNNG